MEWVIGIAVWFGCGFLAYGLALAHFQKKYPLAADERREADRGFARGMFFFGPFGLLVAALKARHGFMWRLPPLEPPC